MRENRAMLCRAIGLSVVAFALFQSGSVDHRPERPHAGVAFTDLPDGRTVVAAVLPGPLNGDGFVSLVEDFGAPDLVVAVNGKPLKATEFSQLIQQSKPGDSVEIVYRKAKQRGYVDFHKAEHETKERKLRFKVARRDDWRGTLEHGPRQSHAPELAPSKAISVGGKTIDEWLASEGGKDELNSASERIKALNSRFPDYHEFPLVGSVLANPLGSRSAVELLALDARALANGDTSAQAYFAKAHGILIPTRPAVTTPVEVLKTANLKSRNALGALFGDREFAASLASAAGGPLEDPNWISVFGPSAGKRIAAIHHTIDIKFAELLGALDTLVVFDEFDFKSTRNTTKPRLYGLSGDLLYAEFIQGLGWFVIGGEGPNTYPLDEMAAIVDLGGNDTYQLRDEKLGNLVILDHAGDDRYIGSSKQGAGSARLGVTLVRDTAGNDVHEGPRFVAGSALVGFSVLIDESGVDRYLGMSWSSGAALYGGGLLLDLGKDADEYTSETFSQAAGGPKAVGLLIDGGGNDTYRATAQDSYSQGFGFGFALAAAGGIGVLYDAEGDDRYIAGSTSQGVGYRHALGALLDRGGADTYVAGEYSQGTGAHLSVGILNDSGGDDLYTIPHSGLGYGYDHGVGLLQDESGDDVYRAQKQALGSGEMNGVGLFLEVAGSDRYSAGSSSFGASLEGSGSVGIFSDTVGGDKIPGPKGLRKSASGEILGLAIL